MAFSFQINEIEISCIMDDTFFFLFFSEAIKFLELYCLFTWIHINYQKLWGPMRALALHGVQVKNLQRVPNLFTLWNVL